MCGRYHLLATPEILAEHFGLQRLPNFQASYNIVPTQKVLCIVELDDGSRKSVNLRWGLIPSWTKERASGPALFNARMETIREKPAFRAAFKHRRCLIAATGFYEWQTLETGKQAFHIQRQDQQPFAFAGLWEQWQHDNEVLYSCTLITTAANALMSAIHERMPVVLSRHHYHDWLAKQTPEDQAFKRLLQTDYATLSSTAISDHVNNPQHDDAFCLRPQKRHEPARHPPSE